MTGWETLMGDVRHRPQNKASRELGTISKTLAHQQMVAKVINPVASGLARPVWRDIYDLGNFQTWWIPAWREMHV